MSDISRPFVKTALILMSLVLGGCALADPSAPDSGGSGGVTTLITK